MDHTMADWSLIDRIMVCPLLIIVGLIGAVGVCGFMLAVPFILPFCAIFRPDSITWKTKGG